MDSRGADRTRRKVFGLGHRDLGVVDLYRGAVRALVEEMPIDGWRGLTFAPATLMQIAALLSAAPSTVQDHLKAIFDEVGVRSRRERVSAPFLRHYLPRIEKCAPVGRDGWFAEALPGR